MGLPLLQQFLDAGLIAKDHPAGERAENPLVVLVAAVAEHGPTVRVRTQLWTTGGLTCPQL
ncbi:MAG: hypothetical protein AMK72_07165 [Planctomycetes bacterium SM23_25]|nr:MAG: hypothetical protein AMK72_07165 [Planctomycetes bacterium SM23_25]